MDTTPQNTKNYASEEQIIYARLLNIGWKIGFAMLLVSFAIYIFGLLPGVIPLEEMHQYWSISARDYLAKAHLHTGWSWVHLVNKGDYLNYVGIAFLAMITLVCYLRIIPVLLKKKDFVYFVLAMLEVVILALAASGILAAGH
ncbi:MAG: hypothetical protein H7833_18745 [Magnetococcus sp. DMHC-1]|nr:hypothetical protein [Magnetococcales bacterium]